MPKGSEAPGKTFPPPVVPIMGFTKAVGSLIVGACAPAVALGGMTTVAITATSARNQSRRSGEVGRITH
jgi:hypothetical protein